MMVGLVFENRIDSREKATHVKEAGRGHHLSVRYNEVLKASKNVQNGKVRVADAFR
jgi:hypothetical protein